MARIKNWKREKKKERSKLTAYAWRNTKTGDLVTVDKVRNGWEATYAEVGGNLAQMQSGKTIDKDSTQSCARSAAVTWMRDHPTGVKGSEELTDIGRQKIQ